MVQHMVGFSAPVFPGSAYIPAVFGTAVYVYAGLVFVKGGLRELRDRLPGMMTLISLAITVAFVFSLAVTLGYPGEALWWVLASPGTGCCVAAQAPAGGVAEGARCSIESRTGDPR
jgi:P-type Cu2+ transporter